MLDDANEGGFPNIALSASCGTVRTVWSCVSKQRTQTYQIVNVTLYGAEVDGHKKQMDLTKVAGNLTFVRGRNLRKKVISRSEARLQRTCTNSSPLSCGTYYGRFVI